MSEREPGEPSVLDLGADMFRLMADHAPAMLWVADTAGRVLSFNRAWYEFTGRTPEQDEGDGWADLLHPDDREHVERLWQETVRQAAPCLGEYRLRRADGQYRWMLDDGRPVYDEHGQLRGFVGSCRDITDRRQRQERYQNLIEGLEEVAFESDGAGAWLTLSPAWTALTGAEVAESIGRPCAAWFHAEDRAGFEEQVRCAATGGPVRFESRVMTRAGAPRWVEVFARSRGSAGPGVLGTIRDIHDQRLEIELLRASERTLHHVAAAVPGVLYQYEVRPDGSRRYTYVSEGVRDLLGVEQDFLLGDPMAFYKLVSPEARVGMFREGEAALREGRPSLHDVTVNLPGGGQRQVRIRASSRLLRDGARVWTGLIIDTSAEKQMASALAKSQERAELALETVADGLWDWNLKTGDLYIAPHNLRMLGYEPQEMPITHITQWRELWHPEDRETIEQHQRAHFEGQSPVYEIERRLRHKSGRYIWVLARGRVVQRDAEGRPVRMVGTNLDLTASRGQERALRESEERFRAAYEHAPVGVVILDGQGVILRANPALCRITGYGEGELIALGFDGLTHAEDLQVNKGPLEELRSGRADTRHYEKRYIHKSGRVVWALVCVSAVREGPGEPTGFIGQILDITAQRVVLAQRQETEARWRAVLESALDCIVTMDEHGRIVDFNPAAERVFGLSRREAAGHDFADRLFPARAKRQGLFRFLGTGRGLDERVQTPALRADGVEFPAELAVVPMAMPSGRTMYTAYLRDLTDQKNSEEALRASRQRFQALGDLAPVGVFLTDARGDATYVNPRLIEMSGLRRERALGSGWLEAVHPEDRERVLFEWYHEAPKAERHTAECRYLTPAGVVRWVHTTACPLRNERHEITGFLGIVTDITELKEAEARVRQNLLQREESLRREASLRRELDHRVRNNLAALEGLLVLYERSGRGDSAIGEALRGKLLAMLEVHEVIARSPGSAVALRPLVIRLATHVLSSEQAGAVEASGPAVHVPPAQAGAMAMVLQEFFTNARKHGSMSHPGGRIRVRWETGPGPTELRLIWEERGGPSVKVPSSFGVGLRLVEGFAASELRGGIQAEFGRDGFSCILRARLADPTVVGGGGGAASVEENHEQPRV
jgi:PAS domain S-box-containing protein